MSFFKKKLYICRFLVKTLPKPIRLEVIHSFCNFFTQALVLILSSNMNKPHIFLFFLTSWGVFAVPIL